MNDKQLQKIMDLMQNSSYGAFGSGSTSSVSKIELDEISDLLDELDIPNSKNLSTADRVRVLVDLVKELKMDNLNKLKDKL